MTTAIPREFDDEYHRAGVYCGEPSHCTPPWPGALPGTPFDATPADIARHWCGKGSGHAPHIGCNGFGFLAGSPDDLCQRRDRHPAHPSCDGKGDETPHPDNTHTDLP